MRIYKTIDKYLFTCVLRMRDKRRFLPIPAKSANELFIVIEKPSYYK